MVPETTGKVFVPILFKWLYAWIWPPLKFTVQTSETRDIQGFYTENSSAGRYLLQQIFHEKVSSNERNLFHGTYKAEEELIGWTDVLRNARSFSSNGRVFKWMSCKEYFALDKDVGDYSNQGTRKVYDYQLGLLALKLCRRQQRTSTLHSPAFQWEVLQTRFDILQLSRIWHTAE